MTASTVEEWLSETVGLDANTIGAGMISDAVKRRMAAQNISEESRYLELLSAAPDERTALIETIVVPDTWFFRDREPFVFLAAHVKSKWLRSHPDRLLRALSLPCSSGEEPYSIAIALLEAGLQPERFLVDAVDISPAMLKKAEKGVYGPNSFRGGLPAHFARYFRPEGPARVVGPEARASVRFSLGNIMEQHDLAAGRAYDIIFCRNLLIYQHAEARARIIAALDRLLDPAGLLFVGHAEMSALAQDRYRPVGQPGAFACARRNSSVGAPAPAAAAAFKAGSGKKREGNIFPAKPAAGAGAGGHGPRRRPAIAAPGPDERLARVQALADQGRIEEAARVCEGLVGEKPQLAAAHFLLGVIKAADGQAKAAEECLNRALYLDSDFHDALIHLALLKERRGDEAGAGLLRRRADRVRARAETTS